MPEASEFTLFHAPGTRSGRTKMLLDLLSLPYTLVPIDTKAGDHKTDAYLKLNPFGVVPTLQHGERVILESAAQAMYLADLVPERKMAPPIGAPERATYYELFVLAPSVMESMVVQAWRNPDDPESSKAIRQALALYDQRLVGPFFLGEELLALDVFIHWSLRFFQMATLEEFPRLAMYRRHLDQVLDWTDY